MKSNTRKVLLGAATIAAVASVAGEANAAKSASIPITARIIAAISISSQQALNFGTISETLGAPGTLKIGPDGAATPAAGITVIGGNQAGQFKLVAAKAVPWSVTVGTATVPLKTVGSANTMSVTSFRMGNTTSATGVATLTGAHATATTGAGGKTYGLGGTLTIANGQAAGTYNGAVTLNAAYQ